MESVVQKLKPKAKMVLHNTNKNNSILLGVFASVFTVSSYFKDNPRKCALLLSLPYSMHIDLYMLLFSIDLYEVPYRLCPFLNDAFFPYLPRGGAGGLSREYVLRIPSVS